MKVVFVESVARARQQRYPPKHVSSGVRHSARGLHVSNDTPQARQQLAHLHDDEIHPSLTYTNTLLGRSPIRLQQSARKGLSTNQMAGLGVFYGQDGGAEAGHVTRPARGHVVFQIR